MKQFAVADLDVHELVPFVGLAVTVTVTERRPGGESRIRRAAAGTFAGVRHYPEYDTSTSSAGTWPTLYFQHGIELGLRPDGPDAIVTIDTY